MMRIEPRMDSWVSSLVYPCRYQVPYLCLGTFRIYGTGTYGTERYRNLTASYLRYRLRYDIKKFQKLVKSKQWYISNYVFKCLNASRIRIFVNTVTQNSQNEAKIFSAFFGPLLPYPTQEASTVPCCRIAGLVRSDYGTSWPQYILSGRFPNANA
jgi:hypothetical protein